MTKFVLTDAVRSAWGGDTPPELPLIEWAAQFVPPGKLALDVGAHVGSWCLTLAPRTSAADWVAFEPARRAFNALCGGIALNGLDDRISPHHGALSDFDGHAGLTRVSEDGGGNHLMRLDTCAHESVDVLKLDSLALPALGQTVGFIKLDVEGSELAVLKGAVHTLEASGWPTIIFECWTAKWWEANRRELFEYVRALGYRTTPIDGWPEMTLAEHGR